MPSTDDKIKKRYDPILEAAAKRNMIYWDLRDFKIRFPRLYATIIEAMQEVENTKPIK